MRDISIVAIVYSFYGLNLNVIVVLSLENRIICATRNMNVFVGHQRFLFACFSSLCKSQAMCAFSYRPCVRMQISCRRFYNMHETPESRLHRRFVSKNDAYRTCILRKLPITSILY